MESADFYLQCGLTMLAAQFSPGPDMLLLLRSAVNHPLQAGLWTVLGISCGLLVHCAVTLIGLAAILMGNPKFYLAFCLAGAGYLLWIAWNLFLSLRRPVVPATENPVEPTTAPLTITNAAAFRQGLLTNLTNAKALVFLASFLAAGLQRSQAWPHKSMLVVIIVGQALVFWSLFVWLLKRPAVLGLYLRSQNILNALFCILLVLLAGRVIWDTLYSIK
jgi:threonine/homoserine/homoserine lactone efflux protein